MHIKRHKLYKRSMLKYNLDTKQIQVIYKIYKITQENLKNN